jgi:hypothetical protein
MVLPFHPAIAERVDPTAPIIVYLVNFLEKTE